jgi:hypothetical protein
MGFSARGFAALHYAGVAGPRVDFAIVGARHAHSSMKHDQLYQLNDPKGAAGDLRKLIPDIACEFRQVNTMMCCLYMDMKDLAHRVFAQAIVTGVSGSRPVRDLN